MTVQQDCETAPLLPEKATKCSGDGGAVTPVSWSRRDVRVTAACILVVAGVIMGTYWYSALLAALESDRSLAWTRDDSMILVTLAGATVTVGLLGAGPFADVLSPVGLLALEVALVCIGLFIMSTVHSKVVIFCVVAVITFAKGIMWPAVNALMAANLAPARFDAAFLGAALGSRVGDVMTGLVLGSAMEFLHFTWRKACLVLMLTILAFVLVAWPVAPRDLEEPHTTVQRVSLSGFGQKWQRLLRCLDGWLVFIASTCAYSIWSLYDYIGVIMVDLYHLTPGEAAAATAWISLGSALGLITAFMASGALGSVGGRVVHTLQGVSAICALLVLFLMPVPLHVAYMLLMTTGFGFVVAPYLPYLLYAATSNVEERAFRCATIDGLGSLFALGFSVAYGRLRSYGQFGVHLIFGIACVSTFFATTAMVLFYVRMHKAERPAMDRI